jgi:hypothetical protein
MFICVCVGLNVVLVACSIHVCSLFYEKLANLQVTKSRRRMQRGASTVNTRIKTLQIKQKARVMIACVCVGLGVVHNTFCVHVCSLFNEKLANDQAAFFTRPMQQSASTENNRIKTMQTKQVS